MTKRAPRLIVALAVFGAVGLGTAGPSIAQRLVSKHELQPTHSVTVNPVTDDDYVKTLIQVTQAGL